MRAMLFEQVGQPLRAVELEVPRPGPGQVLLRVRACGICRTDLHLLDGEVAVKDPPRPTFGYERLWHERVLRSVANLTRADGSEFLKLAPRVPVRTHVTTYPLEAANDALADLRAGRLTGAAVVVP